LRELDGHQRLLTVHDYAYCSKHPDRVDFISTQDWRPELFNEMLTLAERHNGKPVFNIEHGGYEKTMHSISDGAYNDPVVCLERNYKCAFASVYSTYYWQNTSWYEVVTDPFELPEQNQPHFSYYKNFVDFFTKNNFQYLKPAYLSNTPPCLTNSKNLYVFYIPAGMIALTGNVPAIREKKIRVNWFDPLTGIYSEPEVRDFGSGTWIEFRKENKIESPFGMVVLEILNN
jgi:hypothetical protein